MDDQFCPLHKERDKDIKEIRSAIMDKLLPAVNRHTGQWYVLLAFFGLMVAGIGFIYQANYQFTKEMSAYVAAHKEESKKGFEMINVNKATIKELQQQFRDHERTHP
jgi:hypothetical protein